VRTLPILAAFVALAILLGGCGGDEDTHESLAGTPASIHVVNDVETMAHACSGKSRKARQAGIKAYLNLAKLTAIHPEATFGPQEKEELTLRQLLRGTVEKTGHCIGVSVDKTGEFHVE